MREIEEFTQLILDVQRCKAKSFVDGIYRSNNVKYADALITVTVVQANRALQNKLQRYYIDEEYIVNTIGRDSIFCLIDKMCDTVKNCGKEDLERTFHKALRYIEDNLTDSTLYAGSVAEFTGVTQSRLSKLFVQMKGITPIDYIAAKRVEMSEKLLVEGDMTVSEVAQMSGFSSSEAYIRVFKKIRGITPGKYKREKE